MASATGGSMGVAAMEWIRTETIVAVLVVLMFVGAFVAWWFRW